MQRRAEVEREMFFFGEREDRANDKVDLLSKDIGGVTGTNESTLVERAVTFFQPQLLLILILNPQTRNLTPPTRSLYHHQPDRLNGRGTDRSQQLPGTN